MEDRFNPLGKPAPPRPRNPESLISWTIQSGAKKLKPLNYWIEKEKGLVNRFYVGATWTSTKDTLENIVSSNSNSLLNSPYDVQFRHQAQARYIQSTSMNWRMAFPATNRKTNTLLVSKAFQ
jgi:hypothetical protein